MASRSDSALGAVVLCAAAACGPTPAPAPPPTPAPEPALTAADLRGHFRWSHASDADGVRRVEIERWSLDGEGPALTGRYEREVTFVSLDGTPFECNQAVRYRLRSTVELEGTVAGRSAHLHARAYRVEASPCERGYRRLGSYEARPVPAGLALRWDGGAQTLSRDEPPADAAPTAPAPDSGERAPLEGAWRWATRATADDGAELRLEVERWRLTETSPGVLEGEYVRTVTVSSPGGAEIACAGAPHYRHQDRYTVRGTRDGDRITVAEVAYEAEPHPCLHHAERHLDSAIGVLEGGYLVLTWRGKRRQVLQPYGAYSSRK
jgi:hypothetical protein